MRILLTGGTGYLGSFLAKRLLANGHELGCVVRDPKRLSRLEPLRNRVELISVREMERIIPRFSPDTVINMGIQGQDFIYVGNILNEYEAVLRRPLNRQVLEILVETSEVPRARKIVEYLKFLTKSNLELQFDSLSVRVGKPGSNCVTEMMRRLSKNQPLCWQDDMRCWLKAQFANQKRQKAGVGSDALKECIALLCERSAA